MKTKSENSVIKICTSNIEKISLSDFRNIPVPLSVDMEFPYAAHTMQSQELLESGKIEINNVTSQKLDRLICLLKNAQ